MALMQVTSFSRHVANKRTSRWGIQLAASVCLLFALGTSAMPMPSDDSAATAAPAQATPTAYLQATEFANAIVSAAAATAAPTQASTWIPGSTWISGGTTILPNGDRIEPPPTNHAAMSPGKANEIIMDQLKAYAAAREKEKAAAAAAAAAPDASTPVRLSETIPQTGSEAPGPVQVWNQAEGVDGQVKMFDQAQQHAATSPESTVAQPGTPAAAPPVSARALVLADLAKIRAEVQRRIDHQQEQRHERRESPADWAQASGMADQMARLEQEKAAAMAAWTAAHQQQGQGQGQAQEAVAAPASDMQSAEAIPQAGPATPAAAAGTPASVDSSIAPASAPPAPPVKRVFGRLNRKE
ncbi:hypothetical protein V8E36_002397 [Tilletia maclaganii]